MSHDKSKASLIARLRRNSRHIGGCIVWLGNVSQSGYGRIKMANGSSVLVHRAAWEYANGKLARGVRVYHRCGNILCIDVAHLEVPSSEQLFWNNVEKSEGCWIWRGALSHGYGSVGYKGKTRKAYRVAFELSGGIVARGLELDHLCRNRACVRPDHLEPVTKAENMRRGDLATASAARAEKMRSATHCQRGHALTPENLVPRKDGRRGCLACRNASPSRKRASR